MELVKFMKSLRRYKTGIYAADGRNFERTGSINIYLGDNHQDYRLAGEIKKEAKS